MPMLVNRTGTQIPVYRDTRKSERIGTLYPNEHFSYCSGWGGDGVFNNILFRNSAGVPTYGFIIDDHPTNSVMGGCADIFDFPHNSVQIGTRWYRTLKLRRNEKIVNPDGSSWGTGAAGCLVGIRDSLVGDNNPGLKKIEYIQRSSDKAWIKVSNGYGYINIGYEDGSMPSNISLYGSGY
ncbi:MAG: hypothetical protein RR437_08765 [Clostridium sp.]